MNAILTSQAIVYTGEADNTTIRSASRKVGTEDRGCAIEKIYETHVESIYKFIYFKVGNREDAEDIT